MLSAMVLLVLTLHFVVDIFAFITYRIRRRFGVESTTKSAKQTAESSELPGIASRKSHG